MFLAAVCLLWFILPRKLRKPLLLAANYGFYALWEPAFCLLLAGGTAVTYFCARAAQAHFLKRRKLWTAMGAVYMLGVLFLFKYLGFFGTAAVRIFGGTGDFSSGLLLPVGISFYTFAAVGYLFDVSWGKIEAERNILDFAVFQSFFPVIFIRAYRQCGDFSAAAEKNARLSVYKP